MELPTKTLEQIAFNTRPETEEHILIVMDKSIYEEHLSQTLQTKNEQFKVAVTFLTGYNCIFIVPEKNIKLYFAKSITDEDRFFQINTPQGAHEIESLNDDLKRINKGEGHFTGADYPFTIKPNSTLGSLIESSRQEPLISFHHDDGIGDLLGFNASTIYEEYNLSPILADIISFDNIFLETDIAKWMTFKGKISGIKHNFTMDVHPALKYFEKIPWGKQWYMMQSKDFFSSITFSFKQEKNQTVSFNGQSITFRLSIEEFWFLSK